jgi:hypothetical protein
MNKFNIPAATYAQPAPTPPAPTTPPTIPLRDYIAAKALPWVAKDYCRTLRNDGEILTLGEPNDPGATAIGIARECYALADAMLAVSRGEV